MSSAYEELQPSLHSPSTQGGNNAMQTGSSVAADGSRLYPRTGNFPQPSEAAWLAQTYGGASRDYEGGFENRVNKLNKSQNMPTPGEKQENLPMRRPSMRKMVAKHVSTIFNKKGNLDGAERSIDDSSKDDKKGARSRRTELPPLSFDGAGDEPSMDNSSTDSMIKDCANTSFDPYSHMVDNSRPGDTIDNVHHLPSVNLNRASASLSLPPHRPFSSAMSSGTSPTSFSKASYSQPSSISTARSSMDRSTPPSTHHFRNSTRELRIQAIPPSISSGAQPTLGSLDPKKFDPVRLGMSQKPGDV